MENSVHPKPHTPHAMNESDVNNNEDMTAETTPGASEGVVNQSLVDTSGGTPSSSMLVTIVLGGLFLLFSVGLSYYFFFSYRDLLVRERLENTSVGELSRQRAVETQELSKYGVLDAENGIIRVPIEKGIERVLERYK